MKKPGKPKPKRRAAKPGPARPAARAAQAAGPRTIAPIALPSKAPAASPSAKSHLRHSPASYAIARKAPARPSALQSVRSFAADDRSAFGLLLLPFLVVAVWLSMAQSRRVHLPALPEIAVRAPIERIALSPAPVPAPVEAAPPVSVRPVAPAPAPDAPDVRPQQAPLPNDVVVPGPLAAYPPPTPVIERAEAAPAPVTTVASLDTAKITPPPAIRIPAPNDVLVPGPALVFPPPIAVIDPPAVPAETVGVPVRDIAIASLDPGKPVPMAFPTDATCSPSPERLASFSNAGRLARATMLPRPIGIDSATFGRRLAAAAVAQTEDLVIYTARYQAMAYPLGDVMPLHGACIDVVIRAYRTLGIDLQEEIQRGRPSRGDTNIDHRRTENLRRFLERQGAGLPITSFPEDYKPGDIVTYHRPFSRISTSHIAVVTDVLAATGRPMIVHNRGYGPQLEDALFVDRITGHYRYVGPPAQAAAKPGTTPGNNSAATPTPIERASYPAETAAIRARNAAEQQAQ